MISRRLRNIKTLDTRVDLAAMLDDPCASDVPAGRQLPKRTKRTQRSLTSTSQSKTRSSVCGRRGPRISWLGRPAWANEACHGVTIRRRFQTDRSARLLVSAQGHDALDHLDKKSPKPSRPTGWAT